jgi:SNF2 family DNA or RNA helicase
VFVYKLIVTSAACEEKIAALQAQKAALAEAILGDTCLIDRG